MTNLLKRKLQILQTENLKKNLDFHSTFHMPKRFDVSVLFNAGADPKFLTFFKSHLLNIEEINQEP